MGKIGFFAQLDKEEKEQDKTLETIQKQITILGQDHQNLLQFFAKEVKELDDIKENLKIIYEQVKIVEELVNTRKRLVQKLHSLVLGDPDYNVDEAKEMVEKIKQYGPAIATKLGSLNQEVSKYLLSNIQNTYLKFSEEKNVVKEFSKFAGKLASKLNQIGNESYTHDTTFQGLVNMIGQKEAQKSAKPAGKVGFKQ